MSQSQGLIWDKTGDGHTKHTKPGVTNENKALSQNEKTYILKIDQIPHRLLQLLFLVSSPGSQNLSFYIFEKMEPCQ